MIRVGERISRILCWEKCRTRKATSKSGARCSFLNTPNCLTTLSQFSTGVKHCLSTQCDQSSVTVLSNVISTRSPFPCTSHLWPVFIQSSKCINTLYSVLPQHSMLNTVCYSPLGTQTAQNGEKAVKAKTKYEQKFLTFSSWSIWVWSRRLWELKGGLGWIRSQSWTAMVGAQLFLTVALLIDSSSKEIITRTIFE